MLERVISAVRIAIRHTVESRVVRIGEESVVIISRDLQAFGKTYRSYLRAARWSRVAFVALGIVVAGFVVWATPWFHVGMSAGDYSPPVIIAFLLLGLCPAVTAVAVLLRSISKQRREALGAWLSIYDKTTGLHNQDHFFERLRLQCQMGRQMNEYGVGVVLINVEERGRDGNGRAPAEETLHLIGSSIAGEMRPTDLVAIVGDQEIGVLVSVASPVALQIVAERVRRSLQGKLDEVSRRPGVNLTVQLGSASLDGSHSGPEGLLEAARNSFEIVHLDGKHISAA
jgi:diguanylate cyclase (GGDEF)-like protein